MPRPVSIPEKLLSHAVLVKVPETVPPGTKHVAVLIVGYVWLMVKVVPLSEALTLIEPPHLFPPVMEGTIIVTVFPLTVPERFIVAKDEELTVIARLDPVCVTLSVADRFAPE